MPRAVLSALMMLPFAGGGVAQEGPVPDCADLPSTAAGMSDCALLVDPLLLAFLYEPVSDGAILRITQATAEGGSRQSSGEIPVKDVRQAPTLHDMDGDGVSEIFVPTSIGDGVTVYQLWRRDEDGFFRQVDTVSALMPLAFQPRGDLVFHVGPTVEGLAIERAYVLDDAGLQRIYSVQMDRTTGTCAMVEGASVWNEAIILADCEARLGEIEPEGE